MNPAESQVEGASGRPEAGAHPARRRSIDESAAGREPAPDHSVRHGGWVARWQRCRRQGWLPLGYRLLRRVLDRRLAAACFDFRVHQIITVAPWRLRLPDRLARGIAVRELGREDVEALNRLRVPSGLEYGERFVRAHRCVGAWLDQRLVAFMWLRCGPVQLPSAFGCVWQLTAPMAWLYDLYSDPALLGAVPHLYAYLRRHPPAETLQHFVGQTDYDNLRSRLAHRSLGYEVRALLLSWRLGRWHGHASRDYGARRWRWHCGRALIPLHLLTGDGEPLPAMAGAPAPRRDTVYLQCPCGRAVALAGDAFVCACTRSLGRRHEGVAMVGEGMPYWGEIAQPEMEAVLERAAHAGWRAAVRALVPERLQAYIMDPGRADFHELLPLPAGARILDVGAGWGGIAAALARHYSVVALEGVAERARFIGLRQQQDGLERLQVIHGEVQRTPLALGQFDAIIANGILEWVALMDLSAPPAAVQLLFLHRLRALLAPGGLIYLGIENRYGWSELRGALDHSGLRYTSLLPRPLARWRCARSPSYRAHFNVGYRTYTHSRRAYAGLFAQVGLRIQAHWISPHGYNRPEKMIPAHTPAIRFALRRAPYRGAKRLLREALAHGWIWRHLGSDFVFLLQPAGAEAAAWPPPPALRPFDAAREGRAA